MTVGPLREPILTPTSLDGFMTAFDGNAKTAKKLEHDRFGSNRTDHAFSFKPELRAAFYRLRGLSRA